MIIGRGKMVAEPLVPFFFFLVLPGSVADPPTRFNFSFAGRQVRQRGGADGMGPDDFSSSSPFWSGPTCSPSPPRFFFPPLSAACSCQDEKDRNALPMSSFSFPPFNALKVPTTSFPCSFLLFFFLFGPATRQEKRPAFLRSLPLVRGLCFFLGFPSFSPLFFVAPQRVIRDIDGWRRLHFSPFLSARLSRDAGWHVIPFLLSFFPFLFCGNLEIAGVVRVRSRISARACRFSSPRRVFAFNPTSRHFFFFLFSVQASW